MARRNLYGPDRHLKLVAHSFPQYDWCAPYREKLTERIKKWSTELDPRIRQSAFRQICKDLLRYVVHETMMDLHKQLRRKGMRGKQLRSHPRDNYYPQEHFEIHPCERHGVFFRLSVYGNYDEQCVEIHLIWLKKAYDREHGRYLANELKLTTFSYHPGEIKPELFPKLINKGIYEARRVGKE